MFLISGFCIHYPNAAPGPLPRFSRTEFMIKRFVRICLPLAAILAILAAGVSRR